MSKKRKPAVDIRSKVLAYLEARNQGKEHYVRADAILDELIDEMEVGVIIDLGQGRTAILIDAFAGKNIAWKPVAARRFDVKTKGE